MALAAEPEKDFFEQPDERRNFCLLIEGSKVYVCRDYLACYSPVFEKIFFRESFKQQPDDGMPMEGKKLAEFLAFLHAVCPSPIVGKVSDASLATLLNYSDEYDMADLRDRCIAFLMRRLGIGKVLSQALSLEAVLALAEQYNLKVVRDKAAEFMGGLLNRGAVTGAALVDYLKLAVQYDFGPLKKQLVPLVAQLPAKHIMASHSSLPPSVLAAVYQSKWMHAEHIVADAKLPRFNYECQHCRKRSAVPATCLCDVYAFGGGQMMKMHEVPVTTESCMSCKKRLSDAAVAGAPAAKCVCRYADFSADLLGCQ